ncbi:MAG: DUF4114 domain-containing protein [Phycisphaerae bacterium]|nr:DUF4114 domain-containing protein [Phycisphaerae bacterium]
MKREGERVSARGLVLLVALLVTWGVVPAFADFGYTPVSSPPGGELSHAQILQQIYDQNFTASGLNYVGDGGVTAQRVYDFDNIYYNTTHVYNHTSDDVDQIWMDGTVTVTAIAKYATYNQAFGWNGGGTSSYSSDFTQLVDQGDIGESGVSFQIEEGDQFLWGYQAKENPSCSWWEDGENLEWWSRPESNWHCPGEDHMVTYYMEGTSPGEAVWTIFMEDLRLYESDKDYNDFVVEIRAIPEPASILLLSLGGLAMLRKRRA